MPPHQNREGSVPEAKVAPWSLLTQICQECDYQVGLGVPGGKVDRGREGMEESSRELLADPGDRAEPEFLYDPEV